MSGRYIAFICYLLVTFQCHMPRSGILASTVQQLVHFTADDDAHDLVGALQDGVHTQVTHDTLYWIVLQIAVPAWKHRLASL